jgi:hypothetical protein
MPFWERWESQVNCRGTKEGEGCFGKGEEVTAVMKRRAILGKVKSALGNEGRSRLFSKRRETEGYFGKGWKVKSTPRNEGRSSPFWGRREGQVHFGKGGKVKAILGKERKSSPFWERRESQGYFGK